MKHASRKRWLKRVCIALPVLLVLYAAGGFLGVPWVAQRFVVPAVNESLNGTLSITKVRCNPFALSITLEGVDVVDAQGQRVAGVGRFYGNIQASSLLRDGFVFRKAQIDKPFARLEVMQDGSINLASLVKPSADQPDAASPSAPSGEQEPFVLPRLRGEGLEVREAELVFVDRMFEPVIERMIMPVSFTLNEFDTAPEHKNDHVFNAATDASENFDWEGQVQLDPLTAVGWVTLRKLDLERYQPYVGRAVPMRVAGGKVSLSLYYVLAPAANPPVARVSLKSLAMDDLRVTLSDQPLLDIKAVKVEEVDVDAVKRDVGVRAVTVDGLTAHGRRDADGALPLLKAIEELQLAAQVSADASATSASIAEQAPPMDPMKLGLPQPYDKVLAASLDVVNNATQPWTLALLSLKVDGGSARWSDLAMGEPVELSVNDIALQAGPVRSSERFSTPLSLSLSTPEQGTVALKGVVKPLDQSATLEPTLERVALWPGSPYLSLVLPEATMPTGAVSMQGSVVAGWADVANPLLQFTGEMTLESLRIDVPLTQDRPLFAVELLSLRSLSLDTPKRRVDLAELLVQKPVGTLPLAMFKRPEQAASSADEAASNADAPPVEPASTPSTQAASTNDSPFDPFAYTTAIESIRVEQADLRMIDPTVDPQGTLSISALDVQLADLQLPAGGTTGEPATLTLTGKLQDTAPLSVTGMLAPAPLDPTASFVDLNIKLDELPLEPFSGYSAQFVARFIESGQFGTEFPVRLENKVIDAQVPVRVATFKLGESVDREGAIKLPLDLAVAVLTGPDGNIKLPAVPISGDLSDPSVSVFGIVIHAFTNIIANVATAPFKMLGNLVAGPDGAEVDPSNFTFNAGSADLAEDATPKLAALATILKDRPALAIQLAHAPDVAADTRALQQQALAESLRSEQGQAQSQEQASMFAPGGVTYVQAVLDRYQDANPQADLTAAQDAANANADANATNLNADGSNTNTAIDRPRRRIRAGNMSVVRPPTTDPITVTTTAATTTDPTPTDPTPTDPNNADADVASTEASGPTDGSPSPATPALTFEAIEAELLASIELPESAMIELGQRRAQAVREALLTTFNADPARVLLKPADAAADAHADASTPPQDPAPAAPTIRIDVVPAP